MAGTVLQVVESFGGWRLLDDGQPIFWFPEKAKALDTARLMADARHQLRVGRDSCKKQPFHA